MNIKEPKYYNIVSGPNKDMLFDICKYAYSKTVKMNPKFAVAIGTTMPKDHPGCAYVTMAIEDIKILGIEHEHPTGESFMLHGVCKANPNSIAGNGLNTIYTAYKFKAYYDSKTRKGWITFIEEH